VPRAAGAGHLAAPGRPTTTDDVRTEDLKHTAAGTVLVLLLALGGCSTTPDTAEPRPEPSTPAAAMPVDVSAELRDLEAEFAARVGVSALDTGTGRTVEHRAAERFGFASTLKLFAAAELLRRTPADERDTPVTWTEEDVAAAGYSPVTSAHVGEGLTPAELAEAAVRESDNTAMNLLLDRLGGPAGLERGLAELGDETTRVADVEPGLNDVAAGNPANTTTPGALTAALGALLAPGTLPEEDRELLLDWMSGNATGDTLVRAGAPAGWVVADKSGGAGAIRNDVAVVTPPGREPILITVLTEREDPAAGYDDALVARTAGVVLTALG